MHRRGTKLKYLTTYLIITATLIAFDAPRTSVLRNDNGFIDYANRVIVSRGTASVTAKETSQGDLQLVEKNLKLSKGEARARARENPPRPTCTRMAKGRFCREGGTTLSMLYKHL